MSIITLLTDFGNRDEYVGLMKGVILTINPSVAIVDITHRIDRQDTLQAAYAIQSAYRYFPAGSIHLIVVDPGVGTERSLLVLETANQYFVAPDNGVLTLLFNEKTVNSIIKLTNSKYFLETVSQTFHGRDIIAPVGAHLSLGVDLFKMGAEASLSEVVKLDKYQPRVLATGEIAGNVVGIDYFGNLITNINFQMLASKMSPNSIQKVRIRIGSHTIIGIAETYNDGAANIPLALIGSRGYLEVAVNKGSAAEALSIRKGDTVRVRI